MKRKKGFTLIELLAVIIIIGLISVLIVPKVNTTIKDSKKNTYEVSSNALSRAASNYFLEQKAKAQSFKECSYDFTNNINTCSKFEFTGKKPDSGLLTIKSNGKVALAIQFDNYCFTKEYNSEEIKIKDYDENTCIIKGPSFEIVTQETPGTLTPGDEVAIKTEHFYVVSSNETETVLLAKYNLLVGQTCTNSDLNTCSDISNPTGLQDETAKGNLSTQTQRVGVVEFSSTNYWGDNQNNVYETYGNSYPADVYDENYSGNPTDDNYSIAYYVKAYREKLQQMGTTITNTRLLTWDEAEEFKVLNSEKLYSTTFWTGTALNSSAIKVVFHDNVTSNADSAVSYIGNSPAGVRPVIELPTSEIIE